MKDQWTNLNIDLDKLSESIKQFFTQNMFEPTAIKTKNGYLIEAVLGKISNSKRKLQVTVIGKPDNFTVEFATAVNRGKGFYTQSMIFSYIASALGGGLILKHELEFQEELDRIEKTFWQHIDTQIPLLTNTANK